MMQSRSRFFQVAWIVNDIEAAARRWVREANVGPFFILPHVKLDAVRYRGVPTGLDFSGALAQSGPMQIELIQQHCSSPSAYRDVYAPGEEGFHHLCTMVADFDLELRRLNALGAATTTEGVFGDMRYAYLDTRASLGHMTEIIQDRPSIKAMFAMVAEAAEGWDGSDPIRYL